MEGGLGGRALPGSTSGPAAAGGAGGGKGKAKGAEGSDQGQAGSSSLPPAHQAAAKAKEIKAGQGSGPISPCPACIEAVVVGCLGGHEQKSVPCSTAGPYSCGRSCGRPLSCGNHMCSLACHAVQGAAGSTANSAAAAMPCEVCTRPCGKQRGCAHPCDRSCHKGPCPECLVQQRVACHCGKSSLSHPCVVLQHAKEQAGKDSDPLCCGKPCHRQLAFCPHPCRALCHPGACPKPEACAEEVTVRCECKRQRAKWPCSKVQVGCWEEHMGRAHAFLVAARMGQGPPPHRIFLSVGCSHGPSVVCHISTSIRPLALLLTIAGRAGGSRAAPGV